MINEKKNNILSDKVGSEDIRTRCGIEDSRPLIRCVFMVNLECFFLSCRATVIGYICYLNLSVERHFKEVKLINTNNIF